MHVAKWPSVEEFRAAAEAGDPAVLAATSEVLHTVRKAKSEAKLSMRAEVERVAVHGKQAEQARLCRDDLAAAGRVTTLVFETTDDARTPGGRRTRPRREVAFSNRCGRPA